MNDASRPVLPLIALFGFGWMVVEDVFGARLYRQYDLMQIVWCRYAVHLLLMLAVWGWWRPGVLWRTRRPLFQLSRSLLMLVMPASFAFAVAAGMPPTLVWAVFWVAPLLILLLARWLLDERPLRAHWLLAAASVVAAAAALLPTGIAALEALALPAVMAASFSLYVVMTRSLRGETMQANLFYSALGVFLLLTPRMPAVWLQPPLHDIALLVGIGVVGFVSLLALDRAAARASVSDWAPALPMQVAFVALLGWSAGRPATASAVAGVLAIAGIALWVWRREVGRASGQGAVVARG